MRRVFIFQVEIPYERISIKKAWLLFEKVHSVIYDGNKRVVRLKFLFEEVKFSEN